MKIRISKTMANEFHEANMVFGTMDGYVPYPHTIGVHDIEYDLGTAHRMLGFCRERLIHEPSPTIKTAYSALILQLENGIQFEGLKRDGKLRSEGEVSHANFKELEFSELRFNNIRGDVENQALDELAAEIKAHGLIHPITVRPANDGYEVIAGERRARACNIAGVAILAKIIEADNRTALRIQLSENIHREELDIKDRAKAVKLLYDDLRNVQAVADMVKKSKAWISKHLAFANGYGYWGRHVIETGVTEDIETAAIIDKIDELTKSSGKNTCWHLVEQMKAGKMDRKGLRAELKKLKEAKQKDEPPAKTNNPFKEQADTIRKRLDEKSEGVPPTLTLPGVPKIEEERYLHAAAPSPMEMAISRVWNFPARDLGFYLAGAAEIGRAADAWTNEEEEMLGFLIDLKNHFE